MRRIKRGLAVFLAVMLLLPTQGILAAEELPLNTAEEQSIEEGGMEIDFSDTEEDSETEEDSVEEEETTEDETAFAEDNSQDETSAKEEAEFVEENDAKEESSTTDTKEKETFDEANVAEEKPSQEETVAAEEKPSQEETAATEEETSQENASAVEEKASNEEEDVVEELLDEDLVYDIDLEDGQSKDFGLNKKQRKATPSNAQELSEDEIGYNTGNKVYYVVSQEDFENGFGDASFEEDGSYTINIPEENPFFPYEVQFTWEGKTKNVWFMTPEDSVDIGDHTFYVSAFFDGTVVTQMNFEVAGDTVVVYPEKKEFTDGDGLMPLSLLPLEERYLQVDLTGYTPIELTRVSFHQIFTGENVLKDTDNVMWTYNTTEKDYEISTSNAIVDLSRSTRYGYSSWEMIVGAADQLAAENIRYRIALETTPSEQWLIPTLYQQDSEGTRTEISIIENDGYYDNSTNRYLEFTVDRKSLNDQAENYLGLEINPSVFEAVLYDHVTVYSGNYEDPATAEAEGTDITAQIFTKDMTAMDAGYLLSSGSRITIVAYDSAGTVLGCLPLRIQMYRSGNRVTNRGLYKKSDNGRESAYNRTSYSYEDDSRVETVTYTLKPGFAVDEEYSMVFRAYGADNLEDNSLVTAAYVGLYESIGEATQKGATDIKDSLFDNSDNGGYTANYSQGVYFSIFIGTDDDEQQILDQYCIKTKEYEETIPDPNSGTAVTFDELVDEQGTVVSYKIEQNKDSYAEQNFITMLVDLDVDLTNLAPIFYTQTGIHLYAAGSSSPEISGKSFHDFSKGPVQYTASAENGKNAKNYWLHVIKAKEGVGKLHINSLSDENAKTREDENGVIYSTREMFLDGRYDYRHDILVTNVGTEPVTKLSAELVSDQVELDPYWTFKGNYDLAGAGEIQSYGEMQNLAKLRILPKEGVEDGTDISGTLRIKSGTQLLMELTLTGVVGDPCIITKEIPVAVKYVPYGTMIQNSNKYSWNEVSYSLNGGKLPGGMILKPNGELYGVPTEAGEFTFTVRMRNSYSSFSDSQRKFTLTVIENTNINVESATDLGYELIERVPNISMNSTEDHRMVSVGVYDEFVALFLDGERLVEGVDYDSESGSTRITIRNQTLKRPQTTGTHTLGIEFRTKGTDVLKRAAQNYVLTNAGGSGGGSGSGGSSSSGSSSSTSNKTNTTSGTVSQDAKKGHVNSQTGIVTGAGVGYSNWQQDERGWKLIYADGTMAGGTMLTLENATVVEQVLWEKINGAWYAFGVDGYLKTGWIYDYQLSNWYWVSMDKGMQSGWHTDAADNRTYYYLEPSTGAMVSGWKNINNIWYYFNSETSGAKPYGAMYANEATPDGYHVNADGAWDGQSNS